MFNGLTASFVLHIYMGVKECSWTNKNEKKLKKIFTFTKTQKSATIEKGFYQNWRKI